MYFSDCEEEMVSLRSETGTRTTVVIKLKGDIDLMVTPLALESLQKYSYNLKLLNFFQKC